MAPVILVANMSTDVKKTLSVLEGVDPKQVSEGKADVMLPPHVFYNPVQEFNRDLTIAVISQHARDHFAAIQRRGSKSENDSSNSPDAEDEKESSSHSVDEDGQSVMVSGDATSEDGSSGDTPICLNAGQRYEKGLRILEGLAASGLRSVRFALEVPGVCEVVANDFDESAVEFIKKNAKRNGVTDLVRASYSDAGMLMYQSRRGVDRFDVIDIDPYGSPAPFLDAAVQSVRNDGVLCVTCTDMAVLCGNATETCRAKYGATSLRGKFCHEMALRILLQSIESHANRYGRFIMPLLSLSVDFYCRVFVRIGTGMRRVKDSASKVSMVYHCNGCGAFALQPLATKTATGGGQYKYSVSTGPPVAPRCVHCNGRHNLGGPIWSAPIHDAKFIANLTAGAELTSDRFGTWPRIRGTLSVIGEELLDQPLYYVTDDLCRVLHCTALGFLPMRWVQS